MLGRRYASALWYLIPLFVLILIWAPEVSHYYVPGARITSEAIEQSRAKPADSLLQELEQNRLMFPGARNDQELIAAAEGLLRGELKLPNYTASKITVPFDARDLVTVSAPLQFGSLIGPDILLDAYRLTRREEFFAMAREIVIGFAKYERAAWLDRGFLWNDHAIAARIPVLTKFWRAYRTRPDFDPGVAEAVLQMLARSGQLLAKPSHFTFATNHGVMQNLGLLHLCVAFPGIPGTRARCDSAVDRLQSQMGFYVNTEGVVLEHSAGYHAMGLELLGIALRYLTLLDRPIPSGWADKYSRAHAYYAELRRPDGTLPMYGDTLGIASVPLASAPDPGGRIAALHPTQDWRPSASFNLFPVAGHAIWWRGLDKWPDSGHLWQTVVSWGNFPGHGHKRADEMSVLLWRGGQTWVTSSGYWPYDLWGRGQAEGWQGANAPHLSGESANSARTTELLNYADDGVMTVLELRRRGPDGYTAQRQVVQFGSEFWLVLDAIEDQKPRKSITTWTVDPGLAVARGSLKNAYRLISPTDGSAMLALFLVSAGTEITTLKGSREPFAGWVVTEREPSPAAAFMVEQPSQNSWALTLWAPEKRGDASAISSSPQMLEWTNARRWKLNIPLTRGNVVLQRADGEVLVQDAATGPDTVRVALNRAPEISVERAAISAAFEASSTQSRRYRPLHRFRLKVTYFLVALLAIQEIVLFLLRRFVQRHRVLLRAGLAAGWLGMGTWIVLVYLQP